MNRREALKQAAALLGASISAPVLGAALGGCRRPTPYVPQTLTPAQDELVATVAELIIPATETPGARGTKVNEFVDLVLTTSYPSGDRERFLSGLAALDAGFRQAHGVPFVEGTPDQQRAVLLALDRAAVAARKAGVEDLPFFGMMKELTLVGYYTSEVGMTEELRFQPATGSYDGCIPLDQVGKAWATLSTGSEP